MGLIVADKMCVLRAVFLEEDLASFWNVVMEIGGLCAEDEYKLFHTDLLSDDLDIKESIHSLDVLESRIDALCRLLDVSFSEVTLLSLEEMQIDQDVSLFEITSKISMDLDRVEANVMEVVSAIEERKQFIFEQVQIAWFISVLLHSGIKSASELNLDLISVFLGTIPRDGLFQLEVAFGGLDVVIESEVTSRGRVMLLVIGNSDDKQDILGILQAGSFIEVDFSEIFSSQDLSMLAEEIEEKVWQAREEISELNAMLQKKREVFSKLLAKLLSWVKLERMILQALSNGCFGKGLGVVDLWVRDEDKERVFCALMSKMSGRLAVEFLDDNEVNIPKSRIPARFSMWRVLFPFFELVKMYGYPAYDEFNPTVIFAPAFVIMYGMMFADVGHGLVLIMLGWLFRKFRLFFMLALFCGVSSFVFGLLFGSVFGREDIIPALWVSPLHNPVGIMILSIIFGMCYIGVAMLLFALKNFRRRRIDKAVFGEWGIMTFGLYFGTPVMFLLPISNGIRLLLLLLLVFIWGYGLWHCEDEKGIEEKIMMPVEVILNLFSNTISFVRLAAFAINHAALMIVVYVISHLLGNLLLSGVMAILGNIFVIGLESMLVMIQCLRLQYYEFFSKFYSGGGRQFIPLRWRVS